MMGLSEGKMISDACLLFGKCSLGKRRNGIFLLYLYCCCIFQFWVPAVRGRVLNHYSGCVLITKNCAWANDYKHIHRVSPWKIEVNKHAFKAI